MVCPRCIETVSAIFNDLKVKTKSIQLGEVEIDEPMTEIKQNELQQVLLSRGFEMLQDKKSKLIGQIKSIVIEQVHFPQKSLTSNFSTLLSEKLNHEYSSLSKLFSSVESMTIERYIVMQRTERTKELIFYNEFNLSEIAYKLGYSSVAHLSSQFKKETGMTPSAFRELKKPDRKSLDKI